MEVQEAHARCLATSSVLSSHQMANPILPLEVVRVLNCAKVRFVLVGAYGLAGWLKEPRATQDVDVLVAVRQISKAVKALVEAFPQLEPEDVPWVVRLRNRETQEVAFDVMKPVQQPYCEVFHHARSGASGGEQSGSPSLELALVMRFSARTSLNRADEDRHQDAHNFIRIVKQNPDFDRGMLAELGSLIYPEAGKDVV